MFSIPVHTSYILQTQTITNLDLNKKKYLNFLNTSTLHLDMEIFVLKLLLVDSCYCWYWVHIFMRYLTFNIYHKYVFPVSSSVWILLSPTFWYTDL